MKKRFLLIASLLALSNETLIAQQNPTPYNTPFANTPAQAVTTANAAWYRGGNSPGGTAGNANIFGTLWNSPIYTQTFGITRMRLNGNMNQNISVYNTNNLNGYLGLGTWNQPAAPFTNYWQNNAPFSQLHIIGREGGFIQQAGYRPWMRTGISLSDNQDMSYMGLRRVGTDFDNTETVISWADNWGPPVSGPLPPTGATGPDDLTFRFISEGAPGSANNNNILNDLADPFDLDGMHISRFSSTGLIGFGNTFGINATGTPVGLYIRPMSLLHLSYQMRAGNQFEGYGFEQISYRRPSGAPTDIVGQGEQETDGLRFGIDNDIFGTGAQQHLNAYLRWQEASSFVIQTENGGAANIQNNERMRVTSIGALATNYTGFQYFGLNAQTDATRVSISESGSNPLTRPKSLLHLGYDYGNLTVATPLQGYRRWMDLGVLTSTNQDHVWLGLKQRLPANTPVTTTVGAGNDILDAVVAWGTDRVPTSTTEVDNMRFIFTGTTLSGPDGAPSALEDGLEMMRLFPATVYQHYIYNASGSIIDSIQGYGRVGVGDFTAMGVNEDPTQKLDVVGNGRFRYLPDSTFIADSLVKKIVMVDETGVLRWKAFVPSEFGTICSDTVNGKLDSDKKVVLNNHNLYFANRADSMSLYENRVGVGYDCGTTLPAKLSVLESHDTLVAVNTTAILGRNIDTTLTIGITFTGVQGDAIGKNPQAKSINRGGYFTATNAQNTIGVEAFIDTSSLNISSAYGGLFTTKAVVNNNSWGIGATANGASPRNFGVVGISQNGTVSNIGGQFTANTTAGSNNFGVSASAGFNSTRNIGGAFQAQLNPTATNIGVMGRTSSFGVPTYPSAVGIGVYGAGTLSAVVPIPAFAGFFDGNVFINGPANGTGFASTTSDAQFKTNIDTIANANEILALLNPKTFYFDTTNVYGLNFSSKQQYGLIAQEVEQVLPTIVNQNFKPATVDSLGNIVTQSVNYKTLNYSALIPVLIKANQETQAENDSLKSVLSDVNNRLSALENCLSALLPTLCQMNQQAIQANTPATQEQLRRDIAVTLTNRSTIILDQNVPNPFAEQTVINFSIPETVKKAQIHFYNQEGRIIQTVDVVERGLGSVTVFGADLSSGVYTYTLVADGQIVASKKMMKL